MTILKGNEDGFSYFSLISVILFSSLVIYYLEGAIVAVIEW
jgi:hypothetical protein